MKLWKMKRDFQIAFLRQHGLEPQHRLLDLGCGTLRGGVPLIDYLDAGNYVGLEPRAEVLDEGRRELAAHGLEHKRPHLMVSGDLGDVDLGQRFDVIWAFSVVIHMPDEVLDDAFGFAARHLRDDGVFYANANLGERWDAPGGWRGFPVLRRPLEFYRGVAESHRLTIDDMGALTEFGHGPGAGEKHHMLRFRHGG